MLKNTLPAFCLLLVPGLSWASDFKGLWVALDSAHRAIYGYIQVTEEKLYWGPNRINFACASDYKVVLEETAEDYPGNKTPPKEGVNAYTYYKLQVLNKNCDYNQIPNSHIHKKLGYIQIALPMKDPDNAGFNDYDKQGNEMGWGSLLRTEN